MNVSGQREGRTRRPAESVGRRDLRIFREITHPKAGQLCLNSMGTAGECNKWGTAWSLLPGWTFSVLVPVYLSGRNTIKRE